MEGKLIKTKKGWNVIYNKETLLNNMNLALPLHPEDAEKLIGTVGQIKDWDGQLVNYEIAEWQDSDGLIFYVAKIIQPPYISDNFQIGPDGAYEHENTEKEILYSKEEVLMLLHKTALKYFQEGRKYKGGMSIGGDPLYGVRRELEELIKSIKQTK